MVAVGVLGTVSVWGPVLRRVVWSLIFAVVRFVVITLRNSSLLAV